MKPVKTCSVCERSIGVPHRTEADCFRAVDQEIRATMAHFRSLTRRKSQLLRLGLGRRQELVARRMASRRQPAGHYVLQHV